MKKTAYKLIVETTPHIAKVKKDAFPIILTGIFLEANRVNANGRQYDLNTLINAVENFQPMIKEGRALSELEHPESAEINPERACARILKLYQKDNYFMGEAVVLASDTERGIIGTPCGTLLQSLLQYGTSVGWSSRGIGDVSNNNTVTDYHLVTVDSVLNPSTGHMSKNEVSRFVDGILESADFVIKNHPSTEIIFEAVNKKLINLPKQTDAKYTQINKLIEQFLLDIHE